MELCRLDEHLKFTGKTSYQHKCLRSALTEAYVDKRVAGKKGSTNNINTALPLQARNQMLHGMDWWTFGGVDASIASTWFGLRHARLKVVVLQRTVVSSLSCSIFEFWVLRFRDLGASFSVLVVECFLFETTSNFMVICIKGFV